MSDTEETGREQSAPTLAPVAEVAVERNTLATPAFVIALVAAGLSIAGLALPYGPNAERVLKVEQRQAENVRTALALASQQLRSAVMTGAPFSNEFALVSLLDSGEAGLRQTLTTLRPMQAEGMPTQRRVVAEFEQTAAAALIEESTAPDSSWLGQTIGRLSAVSVALLMEAQVNPLKSQVGPVVKEMETAIGAGDLARAVELAETLPEPARAKFAGWTELARKRLSGIAAVDRIAALSAAAAVTGGKR